MIWIHLTFDPWFFHAQEDPLLSSFSEKKQHLNPFIQYEHLYKVNNNKLKNIYYQHI